MRTALEKESFPCGKGSRNAKGPPKRAFLSLVAIPIAARDKGIVPEVVAGTGFEPVTSRL